jgi:uncharacterized membrane protein
MKAGYTKIALSAWLAMWYSWSFWAAKDVSLVASAMFITALCTTALLSYQAGRGADTWK